jgi:hypothetical protein
MAKAYCKNCDHKCHCKGYYCNCKGEPLLLTEENMGWFKKQWQKFIDWIFEGFYK